MSRPADISSTSRLAFAVYGSLKEASGDFSTLSGEVGQLCLILRETEALVDDKSLRLDPRRQEQLSSLSKGCSDALSDLEKLLSKYESLGADHQQTHDRLRYGAEDITALRARLASSTSTLTSFNNTLANASHSRLEKKLDKFISDVQGNNREGSLSCLSTIAAGKQSGDAWEDACRDLGKELEVVGISTEVFREQRAFIITWLLKATTGEGSEEEEQTEKKKKSRKPTFSRHHTVPSTFASIVDKTTQDKPPADSAGPQRKPTMRGKRMSKIVNRITGRTDKLLQAVVNGDPRKLQELLKSGVNIQHSYLEGKTVLHFAAGYQGPAATRMELIDILVKNKAEVDAVDDYGETPLFTAVKYWQWGGEEVAAKLFEVGASVNTVNHRGQTVLAIAIESGSETIFNNALDAGADVHLGYGFYDPKSRSLVDNQTPVHLIPLHIAVVRDDIAMVEELLDQKADVNRKCDGKTALHYALICRPANKSTCDMVRLLLKSGADPNALSGEGQTPLQALVDACYHFASPEHQGTEKISLSALAYVLRVLRHGGADIKIKNAEDETPGDLLNRLGRLDPYLEAHVLLEALLGSTR